MAQNPSLILSNPVSKEYQPNTACELILKWEPATKENAEKYKKEIWGRAQGTQIFKRLTTLLRIIFLSQCIRHHLLQCMPEKITLGFMNHVAKEKL